MSQISSIAAPVPRSSLKWRRNRTGIAILLGALLALPLLLPQAVSVWTRGTFLDPDDALRMVEVRDFLAGQAWFDGVLHRLSPGHPFVMHWSRLADLPLAALDTALSLVLPQESAERGMRIIVPVLYFSGALLALIAIVRRLAGSRAMMPAALLFVTSAEPMGSFLPGHIHHHGLQAMLLLAATSALLIDARPKGMPLAAAAAGVLAIVSLGIGLQNLPFVVGLVGISLLLWVARGGAQAGSLAAFGAGLGAAIPVFLLDVPPGHYSDGACDAFSAAHLLAAAVTGVACIGLAASSRLLENRLQRFAAASVAGLVVIGIVAWQFPACLRDPMSGVDPLLREAWLSGVGEALPLPRLIALSPFAGMALLLTLVGGVIATGWAAINSSSAKKARWLALLGLGMVGVVGCLWQVRVAASTCAMLTPGCAWLALRVFDRVRRVPNAPALLAAVLAGACFGGAGWTALAVPLTRMTAMGPAAPDPSACFDPSAYAELAALPPGLVLSTIDPGSTILAYTPHSVAAAPYHRNSAGNRLSLLALAAAPAAAEPMIRDAGVRYLALCNASNETAETVAAHPNSLSAVLMAGQVPPWLSPVPSRGALFRVFAVE